MTQHIYRAHQVTIRVDGSAWISRRTFVDPGQADDWVRDTAARLTKSKPGEIEVERVETMRLSPAAAQALRHMRKAYRAVPTPDAPDVAVW